MPVIEAQCASIPVPHHHGHINQSRMPADYAGRARIGGYGRRSALTISFG